MDILFGESVRAIMEKTFYGKKLIEVALPLEAVNKTSTREKSIRHGHSATERIA